MTVDGITSSAAESEALRDYRRTARAWLTQNLQRQHGPALDLGVDHFTPEVMAANRALQRRLFDGGYAGITWPVEYGGQGLPSEYEWAFVDEAAGFVLPDFGPLTITTFYVCVPTMLAHAPPEFLRRFVPKVLAGEELVCQFFSEPSSGSDLAGARTRATRDGEQWIDQRPEDLEHLRSSGRFGHVPRPHGLGRPQAPGPHLVPRAMRCTRSHDQTHKADKRRSRVLRGILRRCRRARHPTGLRGQRGLECRPRRCSCSNGVPGDPRTAHRSRVPAPWRPTSCDCARHAGRLDDPIVRQKLAELTRTTSSDEALSARIAQMARLGPPDPGRRVLRASCSGGPTARFTPAWPSRSAAPAP